MLTHHTCILIACLYIHCMLARSFLDLHILTLAYFAFECFRSSSVCVSVEVSLFKDFPEESFAMLSVKYIFF